MRRKILSLTLMLCLLCSTPVSASVISSGALVDGSKTVAIPVSATIESTFTVSLPPDIVLAKQGESNTYSYTSQVGVKGDTIVDSNIVVQPQSNIVVYDVTNRPANNTATPTQASDQNSYEHKDPQSVTVTQTKTIWPYSELRVDTESFKNTNVTISTDKISAGDWEGTLVFSISYGNDLPGLYNESGVMTASWDQLVSDGTIHVNEGVVTTNYSSNSNSSSEALSGKLVIPDTVTTLANCAFNRCTRLTSVVVPDTVNKLGAWAFSYCTNIRNIILPDNSIKLSSECFSYCSNLNDITIPSNASFVKVGGDPVAGLFRGCNSLISLGDLESNCNIKWGPNELFYAALAECKSIKTVDIPDYVTKFNGWTFTDCTNLTSVHIPSTISEIGTNEFYGCTNLQSVDVPNSVTSIGGNAFYECTSAEITIPDSVTKIGSNAFKEVPHIYYNGTATGKPWGAKAIN